MKLDGVRVVELSLFLPGPHLTMMMADHGADVIKVEPYEGGEPVRHIGPKQAGESVYFRNTHRGKRPRRVVPAGRGRPAGGRVRGGERPRAATRLLLDLGVRAERRVPPPACA